MDHLDNIPFFFFLFLTQTHRPKRKPKDLKLIIPPRNNFCFDAGSSSLEIPFIEIKREIRNLRSNRMAMDIEDVSDSGIEKADDMSTAIRSDIVIPNSLKRIPPEGAEINIQIDQLRPHNQQQFRNHHHQPQEESNNQNNAKKLSTNFHMENKCQATQSATNSTANVSFIDINVEDLNGRSNRLSPQRGGIDSSTHSINQYGSQREQQQQHHSVLPFSNTTYAAFKKGNVVRGILCPSLTNSFR